MVVSNQSTQQIDHVVDRASIARMPDLRDVFELIDNGIDENGSR